MLQAPPEVRIQGRIVDQSGLPLPGVSLRVMSTATRAEHDVVTTADGTFSFDVAVGDYRLAAALDGFEPLARDFRVAGPATLPDLVMGIAHLAETTTVVASVPTEVQPRQFGAPAVIAEKLIDNAPLRTNRYDDMLPLLPNVVRGPDGLISVAGARAPQGVLLLNGVPASDVASGTPVASVPLGAVESVEVIGTGFPVEYGPSTGGVTIITSRAGSDTFRFAVNSFTPRLRLADWGIRGVEAWNPNLSVRGPIARGRAWFAQSIDYHFEKARQDTVYDGTQDRKQKGFTSFSQVDAKAGPHIVTGWFSGQKQRVDGERLGAFTPLGTVPTLEHSEASAAVVDRVAFGTSTIETRVHIRRQNVSLAPDGEGVYQVAHDVTRGAYFGTLDRDALSGHLSTVFSRMAAGRLGHHLFKAGGSAGWRDLDGHEQNETVTYLRTSLVPAIGVEFLGAGTFDAASTQLGAFAQDEWALNDRLTLDAGVRFDHDSRTGSFAAPRVGLTWGLGEKTTVSGGAGWFTGDMPLAALAFDGYQARRITRFDERGLTTDGPVTYRNIVSDELGMARARMWSARIDRRLNASWQLRAAVQERRGTNEAIVAPRLVQGAMAALLSTGGRSQTRSFEATLGYHPLGRPHQLYLSYVRSKSEGSTNDFGLVEGLFKDPRLEAPEMAALPSDVPHRVLAWGLFSLPAQVTVAPFLDVRSGFAYSALNDDWSYAGPRFTKRYPLFASLDVVVNKIVTLPGGMRARVGVKLYNVAGRRNGRDVQADISRADFGRTYNALGRQVRGVFEIIWGGGRK